MPHRASTKLNEVLNCHVRETWATAQYCYNNTSEQKKKQLENMHTEVHH